MPDKHADGEIEVLLVRPGKVAVQSDDEASLFYAENCYIVKYTHSTGTVLYYWIVSCSYLATKNINNILET